MVFVRTIKTDGELIFRYRLKAVDEQAYGENWYLFQGHSHPIQKKLPNCDQPPTVVAGDEKDLQAIPR